MADIDAGVALHLERSASGGYYVQVEGDPDYDDALAEIADEEEDAWTSAPPDQRLKAFVVLSACADALISPYLQLDMEPDEKVAEVLEKILVAATNALNEHTVLGVQPGPELGVADCISVVEAATYLDFAASEIRCTDDRSKTIHGLSTVVWRFALPWLQHHNPSSPVLNSLQLGPPVLRVSSL